MKISPRTPHLDSFLRERLPQLIVPHDKLHVTISTYNSVRNYNAGPVETKHADLAINIHCGHAPSAIDILHRPEMQMAVDLLGPQRGFNALNTLSDVLGNESRGRLARGVRATMAADQDTAHKLVFIYHGRNGGSAPLETARQLHGEFGADIVIVACTCFEEEKIADISPLIERGIVRDLYIDSHCGGKDQLRGIIDEILRLWPDRHTLRASAT